MAVGGVTTTTEAAAEEPLSVVGDADLGYTDEELAAALQTLGIQDELIEDDDLEELPEISVDDNDPLLREYFHEGDNLLDVFENEHNQQDASSCLLVEQLTLDEEQREVTPEGGLFFDGNLYCQPCNSPTAIPPPSVLLNDDAAWAAAAVLAEELEYGYSNREDEEEEAFFWRQQISLLEQSGALDDLTNDLPELFESLDMNNEHVPPETPQSRRSSDIQEDHTFHMSRRPEALEAAAPFIEAFGSSLWEQEEDTKPRRSNQRECLGHKERILGCGFSPCGKFLATASQDSTIRIWKTGSNQQVSVLNAHSKDHECLRVAWASGSWGNDQLSRRDDFGYVLATGGADGVVHLWGCHDPSQQKWTNYATLDHATFNHVKSRSKKKAVLETVDEQTEEADSNGAEDASQIYALQFIDHWDALPSSHAEGDEEISTTTSNSFLLTSSDDHVHLWEIDQLNKKTKAADGAVSRQLHLREVLSLKFVSMNGPARGVMISPVTEESMLQNLCDAHAASHQPSGFQFGGERNPENLIFVFDAFYCATNGLLGVALSDGSLRLMNGRGVCLSVLELPGGQSHLTSFAWDSTGTKLVTTVATGHLITWGIELTTPRSLVASQQEIRASCFNIMEGGHLPGRPVFGAHYLNDDLLLSWGSDGRLCLWDSKCEQEVDAPISVLWEADSYPVYAVSVTRSDDSKRSTIAIAGGGSVGGFLGIPVYLQDINIESASDKKPVANKNSKTECVS